MNFAASETSVIDCNRFGGLWHCDNGKRRAEYYTFDNDSRLLSSLVMEPNLVPILLPCTECGYNLRMQPKNSRCPECGEEVARSLWFTLLQNGPDFLLRIGGTARFAAMLNLAALGLTGGFILLMFLVVMFEAVHSPEGFFIALFAVYAIIAFLHIIAGLQATVPVRPVQEVIVRPVVLMSACAFWVATLVPLVLSIVLAGQWNWLDEWFFKTLLIMWSVLFPSLAIFVVTLGIRYVMVCKSAGLHSLVGWHKWTSRIMAAGVTMLCVVFWFVALVVIIELRNEPPRWFLFGILALFWGGLFVAGLGFIVATIVLLRTGKRFHALARDLARDIAEASQPGSSSSLPQSIAAAPLQADPP